MLFAPHRHEINDASGDPTKTFYLRRKMRSESDRRWQLLARTVREALIEHDILGLRGIGRLPHGDKADGFAAWLDQELQQKVMGGDGGWTRPYIQSAAEIAQRHAHSYTPAGQHDPTRITTMENMTVRELTGITTEAWRQITRVVTEALAASSTPTQTANKVSGVIQGMRKRTWAMGDWMIARTHAATTLSIFRDARVAKVGIIPEHKEQARRPFTDAKRSGGPGSRSRKKAPSARTIRRIRAAQRRLEAQYPKGVDVLTAEDENVCIVCEDISANGPYGLDEAEGLIPAHVYCRCAFVPAGMLEDMS